MAEQTTSAGQTQDIALATNAALDKKPGFLAPVKVRATWLVVGVAVGMFACMYFTNRTKTAS